MKFFLWNFPAMAAIIFFSCNCAGRGSEKVIKIDGSSTVYPITEAVTEEFIDVNKDARITVGVSGTGGGFKKLCRGELDISNASRAIKESEVDQCNQQNLETLELSVAFDGMAVLVHPENDWVDHLTVEELKKIWRPEAQAEVTRWNQIRPEWPDEELHLFGPGVASGTYDYFTEAVVGESGMSRGDFTASEDDNVLVQGISTDLYSLGFFGLAYYQENQEKLKLVPIDNGDGPVTPTIQSVKEGVYTPLSRPLFIYVRKDATAKQVVNDYVTFYLQKAPELARQAGYVPMTDEEYEQQLEKFRKFSIGGDTTKKNNSAIVE